MMIDGRKSAATTITSHRGSYHPHTGSSPAYTPDRGVIPDERDDYDDESILGSYYANHPAVSRRDGRPVTKSLVSKLNTDTVKSTHEKIRSKYGGSVSIEETFSKPKREFRDNPKYKDEPKKLAAHVVEQEVDTDTQAFHINESEFIKLQSDLFGRSESDVKQLRAKAAKYMFRMTGKNFSVDMNPNAEKYRSSLVIKTGEGKDAKHSVKLSPYVVGNNISWKVDVAEGFPSIQPDDRLKELGYVFNVVDPSGVTVNGAIGGKEGKLMKPGESLYFCEFMIRPGRSMRKPVWIRARSIKPSETVDECERKSEFAIGYISLFQDGRTSPLKDYKGTAERVIRIEPITVTSKANKDAVSKAKEETLSKKKKVTASFVVDFNPTPTLL
jgi:hypothetical protein